MRKMVLDALVKATSHAAKLGAMPIPGSEPTGMVEMRLAAIHMWIERAAKLQTYLAEKLAGECEWEERVSMNSHTGEQSELYVTACGQEWNAACNWAWSPHWDNVFCPYCGRRIRVKEDA